MTKRGDENQRKTKKKKKKKEKEAKELFQGAKAKSKLICSLFLDDYENDRCIQAASYRWWQEIWMLCRRSHQKVLQMRQCNIPD